MARRAVQGYTEKSYYDNTRYIGNVSTLDPLLEGSFRHLVNFNISDTNQSLEPREGFFTTTLGSATALDFITLSKNTIIYKDQSTQLHVVFDVSNNAAYLADISENNIVNKMIPFKTEINIDYTDYLQYLKDWYIKDLKVENPPTLLAPPLKETSQVDYNKAFVLEEATYDEYEKKQHQIKYDVTNSPYLSYAEVWRILYEDEYDHYDALRNDNYHFYGIQIEHKYTAPGSLTTYEYQYFIIESIDDYNITTLNNFTKVLGNSTTVFDEALSKRVTVVPVEFGPASNADNEYTRTFLSLNYRKNSVTIDGVEHPGNTLVVGVVNFKDIGSYNPLERNIASPYSIFPTNLQTIYTEYTRPLGHVDVVGMFYAYNSYKQAMINTVFPRTNYTLIPHFELNPPNVSMADTDAWAYAFDIVSTKPKSLVLGGQPEEVIARSDWLNIDEGVPIMSMKDDLVDTDLTNNNINETRYLMTLIPISTNTVFELNDGEAPSFWENFFETGIQKHRKWYADFSQVYDKHTLYEAIKKTTGTLFIIHDLHEEKPTTFKKLYTVEPFENNINITSNMYKHSALYKTFPTEATNYSYKEKPVAGYVPLSIKAISANSEPFFDPDIFSPNPNNENTLKGIEGVYTKDELLSAIDSGQFHVPISYSGYLDMSFRLLSTSYDKGSTYTTYGTYWENECNPICYWYGIHGDTEETLSAAVYEECCNYVITPSKQFLINDVIKKRDTIMGNNLLATTTDMLNTSPTLEPLQKQGYFVNGYHIRFYLRPYKSADFTSALTYKDYNTTQAAWRVDAYSNALNLVYSYDKATVTNIEEYVKDHPERIANFDGYTVFEDSRIVFWKDNYIYISEPGRPYYFKEDMVKSYNERIVKVVPYKSILLVFTVQNLYAVYENVVTQEGKDHEGKSTSVEIRNWVTTPVLYNILTNKKYADVIQVFNQMVLFYSDDGQLFLIKPNTMIDSDTRFSLQYFNKSCNDILANYDKYINERLEQYNIKQRITKDDVTIKAEVSINYIKIFYSVKDVITYILIYDVLNNRYYVYDTLSFTNIKDMLYTDSGSLYNTINKDKMYFTMQHTERIDQDVNVDQAVYHNFKKAPILCLIDTGNLSLNNHLRKRFRDLHITFKNLSSSKLLYNVETVIDDVVSHPFYDEQLLVKEFNGQTYYITVPKANENDLVELSTINQISGASTNIQEYLLHNPSLAQGNIIFNFKNIVSSKILTHRSSILGMGNVFRAKMLFTSKGKYKIQSYGIVYKERRV